MSNINHKPILKRAIILCWFCLGVCLALKLFLPNQLNIIVKNESFINFCYYVDHHKIIKLIIYYIISFISTSLYYLSMLKQFRYNKSQLIVFIFWFSVIFSIKVFSSYIGFIVELIIMMLVLPYVLDIKIKRILTSLLTVLTFQVISIITRDIHTVILTDNDIIYSLVMSLDMYIMLVLYYLYCNKEDE